jgi:hypothetical protein
VIPTQNDGNGAGPAATLTPASMHFPSSMS